MNQMWVPLVILFIGFTVACVRWQQEINGRKKDGKRFTACLAGRDDVIEKQGGQIEKYHKDLESEKKRNVTNRDVLWEVKVITSDGKWDTRLEAEACKVLAVIETKNGVDYYHLLITQNSTKTSV